jgi:hypothetical protein
MNYLDNFFLHKLFLINSFPLSGFLTKHITTYTFTTRTINEAYLIIGLINLLDILEEGRPLTFAENCLRSLAMDALHLAIRERSVYWKTRAKVRFALEGDENTKFFHASATCRLRRNSIPRLVVDGVECNSHPEKASVLKNYYSDLLGTATGCTWHFDLSELYPLALSFHPPLATLSPLRRLKKLSRI